LIGCEHQNFALRSQRGGTIEGSNNGRAAITQILSEAQPGDADLFDRLLPAVYEELHSMAARKLRNERDGHTLNATALVHEAYLKLVDQTRVQWQSRGHFFAVASQAMRRILVNYARERNAQKRGGKHEHLRLDEAQFFATDAAAEQIEALDEALTRLGTFDERGAKVVTYRYFGGLTHAEIATVLGTSEATVRRAWITAKAWLRAELTLDLFAPGSS